MTVVHRELKSSIGALTVAAASDGSPRGLGSVAYVVSRFPKLTETFVLYELLALQELGYAVELFPLLREREPVVHPEAERLVREAHYQPFLSGPIVRSQVALALRRPRAYFGTLLTIVREALGSANYLVGGLAIFPKVAHAARMMEDAGVEHVHCHFANHPATAGYIVHRLTGIPFSFTAHGSDLHRDRHMLHRKVREAVAVVAISEYNRRLILDECGTEWADKVSVVHCGVDTDVFRPTPPAPSASSRPLSVVCVGSFEEVKGHEYLLRACRLLADEEVDFTCRLVGDGPLRARIEQLVRDWRLEDSVVLEGRRNREEVAGLLRSADIAVTPSVWTRLGDREGIPVVLMEAMSSGVAVVASAISGIPELVEHERNGLLVPPADPDGIAAAITRLARDPELRTALGRVGRETVLREFDVRRNALALTRVLEAVHR
jgi:colanic acid/amylovoran biosynthesis glycosyltransferase